MTTPTGILYNQFMAFNKDLDQLDANVNAEDIAKRKNEGPIAVAFRNLFRLMGKDLSDIYTLTGRPLDASAYVQDVAGILRPAYRKTMNEFSTQITTHLEDNQGDFNEALVLAMLLSAERAGISFANQLTAYEGLKNQRIRQFINDTIPKRTELITTTNQKHIDKAIFDALAEAAATDKILTQAEVGTLAGRKFSTATLFRGQLIAETEVLNAAEAAKQISTDSFMDSAGNQAGLVAEKLWVTRGDERVRPSHVVADFQVQPIDQAFTVGGSLLRFPGDSELGASAAETINCRCNSQQSIDFAEGAVPPQLATPPL